MKEFSYSQKKTVKALSEKIKIYFKPENLYKTHTDPRINSRNLSHNTAKLISEIILSLHFPDRSIETFKKIINDFNTSRGAELTFEDFKEKNWIRVINDEALIPERIEHAIRRRKSQSVDSAVEVVPIKFPQHLECLGVYYDQQFENAHPSITQDEIFKILNSFGGDPNANFEYLKANGLFLPKTEGEIHYWATQNSQLTRYLRNEIATLLWKSIMAHGKENESFRKFIKIANECISGVPTGLDKYLDVTECRRLCHFSYNFLQEEQDLVYTAEELEKILYDAPSYTNVNITDEFPKVQLQITEYPHHLIEHSRYIKRVNGQVWEYEPTRSVYGFVIGLILENDQQQQNKYENLIKLLLDSTRPFLVIAIYDELKKDYAHLVPYLLCEPKLLPFAFKVLGKFETNDAMIPSTSEREQDFQEGLKIKHDLIIEMFQFCLEDMSRYKPDNAEAVFFSNFFYDLAEGTFNYKSNHQYAQSIYLTSKKLYETVLERFSNQRSLDNSGWQLRQRYFPLVLPGVFKEIENRTEFPPINELVILNTGKIDLLSKLLSLVEATFLTNELNSDSLIALIKTGEDITKEIRSVLITHYTKHEVQVIKRDLKETEPRKARRGILDFGIEIIDWSLVFLNLSKLDLLNDFDTTVKNSLLFETASTKDIYDDQNQEQYHKLIVHIKILLLAYSQIQDKREKLQSSSNYNVQDTLYVLQKQVIYYSLKYSVNDVASSRIDAFDEKNYWFNDYINRISLVTLLFQAVKKFDEKDQLEFVKEYFNNSNEVGRMLTALNTLEAEKVKDAISKSLSNIDIESFANSRLTINDLETVLIEAINSESNFNLARPFLTRMENHVEKNKSHWPKADGFFFSVKLILAYKNKDEKALREMEIPETDSQQKRNEFIRRKQYYLALIDFYEHQKIDEAISVLENIQSLEPDNVEVAVQLFRAKTHKELTAHGH